MLPVSRLGQPVGTVTTISPWLSVSCDPTPHWLWLTSWFQATPPFVFYPPAVWIPEHTHLIQWERRPIEVIHLRPPLLSQSASLHRTRHPHPLPKLLEGWISPEEVGVFPRREKHLLLTNQIIQRPGGHTPRTCLLLCPSQLSGHVPKDAAKSTSETEDSPSSPLLHLSSVSPLHLPLLTTSSLTAEPWILSSSGGAYYDQAVLHLPIHNGAWPLFLTNQQCTGTWLQPVISLERRLSPLLQVMKEIHPSFFSSRFSSRFTLLTNYRHKKRGMTGGNISYGGALLLSTEMKTDDNKQSVDVSSARGDDKEEEGEEEWKDKRPVASSPVPGSPWCVVWTGDDRVFFFNPTIHLSVWDRPGDLIGRDISRIIKDPPHKRKKSTTADKHEKHKYNSKRSRTEESVSLVPRQGEVQLLPLELRVAHFREMMLERGVSAFSTWEKELHKMVFDPRYLLLTSDQRKQVFDKFVKSRVKDEYKEKKSKLQKAREEFKQLLEEVKITSRSTFKEFCARYRSDHRFNALNRKQEQEVLFNHYITSLKKRNKENKARLRKMR